MPSLGVVVEQLHPDTEYVQIVLASAHDDIRLCECFFDHWVTQSNKCAATRSPQPRGSSNNDDDDLQGHKQFQETRRTRAVAEMAS